MTGLRLLRVERIVSSLDVADFYRQALGFEMVASINRPGMKAVDLSLGQQTLRLVAVDQPGLLYPSDSNAADLWFQHIAVVTADIDTAYNRLMGYAHTAISKSGPQKLPPNAGGVIAYKFRDPDGHPIELIHFPQNKPIGIDHSAISVSDAGRSIDFYCNVLGLKLTAQQINKGIQQDCLDGLANDLVEVIALEPAQDKTPHIELLAYHSPQGRRCSYAVTDIVADRLVLQVDDLEKVLARLKISQRPHLDSENAAMIRDPDGHFLILTQAVAL